jgi:TonB family protein
MNPPYGDSLVFTFIEPGRIRRTSIIASVVVHVALLVAVIVLPLFLIGPARVPQYEMTVLSLPAESPVIKPSHWEPPPVTPTIVKVPSVPVMKPPPVVTDPPPVRETRPPETPTEPKPAPSQMTEQTQHTPMQASTPEPATPVEARVTKQVQTGGFGDVKGVQADGRSSKVVNVASLGSFDLPAGEGSGDGKAQQRAVVATLGFDSSTGNSNRPVTRSASVNTGGFETVQIAASQAPRRTMKPIEVSVEIVSKPRPEYSEEARRMRIQGEVAVRVMFAASGQVRVLGLVRGLGYGLDDKAVRAAEQIQFKPATSDGVAVDSTAIVRIAFQLAY